MKIRITLAAISASLVLLTSACSFATPEQQMFDTLKVTCKVDETANAKDSKAKDPNADIANITVSKDMKKAPTVDFMTPLDSASPKLQTKVIVEGTGPKITGGQYVTWEYAVFSGSDKSQITSTAFDGKNSQQQLIPQQGELCLALVGVRKGSRIALLVPSEVAGTSATGEVASQVWVFDILDVFLPKAVGDAKATENGMPTVVRDTAGIPSVTIPNSAQPTTYKDALLIEGKGGVVKSGDSAILHYSGYLWSDGSMFDSSWAGSDGSGGQPITSIVDESHFIKGFVKAIVGKKVGSQVIAVIPADLAYGSTGQGTIPGDATLVFVIDILGVVK